MSAVKHIGVLTGGGDCPGLNPVIRAVVRSAVNNGIKVTGFKYGWKGVIENETVPLDIDSISGILHRGGTILGTSRTNPYKRPPEDLASLKKNLKDQNIDCLVAIGGEDTLGVATKLDKEGIPVIGVPKTIDNDLSATDYTFGFDTAVNIAMEAIDRLHTTAESHQRIMVVEVMGRHAGWIATYAGISGGADVVLVPEHPIVIKDVCDTLKKRHARGKDFSIVVVAEGAQMEVGADEKISQELDEFGHVRLGGIGQRLSDIIEKETGCETRVTVLGHIQRGGSPTAFDRVLGTRFGIKAVECAMAGDFGKMVSLQGNSIEAVPIEEGTGVLKTVDENLYNIAKVFFG